MLRQNIKVITICQRSFFLICESWSFSPCMPVMQYQQGFPEFSRFQKKSETTSFEKINFPVWLRFHYKAWFFDFRIFLMPFWIPAKQLSLNLQKYSFRCNIIAWAVIYFLSKNLINLLRQNIKVITICQRSFFLKCESWSLSPCIPVMQYQQGFPEFSRIPEK